LSDPIDPSLVHEFGAGLFVQPVPQEWFKRWVEDSLKVPVRVWKAAWKGRLEASDAVNELDQIEAPTLVIWGDGDTRCPRRHQETLIEEIPDARLVVYPGAGHGLHAEEPERFATDVAAFVRDRVL
jgi:pimeloyl-ACP methyl ester carboxylesterase